MKDAGLGREYEGILNMEDVFCQSEWIVGVNQIATRLR